MRYFCLFFLFLISNALFCVGDYKEIDRDCSDVVDGIESIFLFPNQYEFQAVYDYLLKKGATDIKCKELGMIFEELYNGKSENMSLALVKINEKKFWMATCGEGTYELLPFFQRCFQVFKKLKTVILGGICGCPSNKVAVGDVLLAKDYNFIKKISIGDAENRKPSPSCEVD